MESEESFVHEVDEKASFLSQNTNHAISHERRGQRNLWIVAVTVLSILCILLSVYAVTLKAALRKQSNTFATGYDTELEPAKIAIKTHKVHFTGGIKFDENGTMYRDYPRGGPVYFGPPSDDIDNAWDDLLYSSGIDLAGEEADSVKGITFEEPMGGLWRTGLDVFHVLHCLNFVRQALDLDYYPPTDSPHLFLMHRDHCLDYIRQSVMCAADATPVPLVWRKESHFLIPQFNTFHTCRNFDLLHSWSKERAAEIHHAEAQRLINSNIAKGEM